MYAIVCKEKFLCSGLCSGKLTWMKKMGRIAFVLEGLATKSTKRHKNFLGGLGSAGGFEQNDW